MGMRFPVGPMRGRAQPNPWLYVGPEERRAAEDYLVSQGGPNLWGMLDPRDPLHPANRAGDGTPLQEKMYEQNLRDVDDWTYANIVTPMTARGYDTLGPALGAGVAGAYETFMPGPEGWGFGMAGGGKKVENLWDLMTPEAREAAEQRMKELRDQMMEGSVADQTGPIDPYAPEAAAGGDRRVNPYEAMQELERRTLDPDTGLPIERRDEYGRDMTQRDVDANKAAAEREQRAAEAAAERAEARKNMSWRDRMDEDVESWWDEQWDMIDDGSMWDSWSYSDEVPTRGDELEMLQDVLRNNSSFRKEIKNKIYEGIDDDDPPDDFFDWLDKEYPGNVNKSGEEPWEEWPADSKKDYLDKWSEQQADEYIEKKIKEWEPDADSWNQEIDYRDPVERDQNYDFHQAPFGKEKIYGEMTRTRRYIREQFKKPWERLKRIFGDDEKAEELADELSENIYKSSVDDFFNENQREVWESQWDLSDEVIIDRLPDKLDDWDEGTLKKVYEDEFDQVVENLREDIDGEIDHFIERSGQPLSDNDRKSIKKFIFENVKNDIKESWEKGMQENVEGLEDDIIDRLKDQVDDD